MDKQLLEAAIEKAKESVSKGGFPAGAVVVKDGVIVGEGISVGNKINDPTAHGEMASIRSACKSLQTTDLKDCVLYASMQPCLMCLGAAMWSALPKIVYACSRDKVSDEYYGGHYDSYFVNSKLTKPIEIIHLSELEDSSLGVVLEWEKSL